MDHALFGMETELAVLTWKSGEAEEASPEDREGRIAELFELASERLCCLHDEQATGLYLANGSRLYLDAGLHPELCTPECRSPEEVVRWQLAGERILAELAGELEKQQPDQRISLFRCNVDYSGGGNTWGCHESYQNRSDAAQLSLQLIPHLVTRIVYSGAGGFNNRLQELEFLLSPRVPHLLNDVGADSQSSRSLYHTKNEPLSGGGFNRLHLLCGESNSSQLSTYLKIGTTALIVRMIDAGVCRGGELRFASPRDAMNTYARDPECRDVAELADGRRLTAVQIQREYLAMIEEHIDADFMPEWAPEVRDRWAHILDQLESDRSSLSTRLDWAIKHALFQDRAARSEMADSLRAGSGLGAELCEVDTRFGELGPNGLFHCLDRADVLDHRLSELGSVDEAMLAAPAGGRAEVRGNTIRELQPLRDHYLCAWDGIHDMRERRRFDLSDPYGRDAAWAPATERRPRLSPRVERRMTTDRRVSRGVSLYQSMELTRAAELLEPLARAARSMGDAENEALARFWCATALQDLGQLDAAEEVLVPILETHDASTSGATTCRVWTRYALVLIDRAAERVRIEEAIRRMRSSFEMGDNNAGRSRLSMVEARLQGALGRYDRAAEIMERALEEERSDGFSFARSSYLRWLVHYLLRDDQIERAALHVDQWRHEAENGGSRLQGDVMLACAESMIARRRGRSGRALDHARVAIERITGSEPNRYRIHAYCTLIESAVEAGELEAARPYVEELCALQASGIGEQRCDTQHAKAIFFQAEADLLASRGRVAGRASLGASDSARDAITALRWQSDLFSQIAQTEARSLDERLETTHHAREIREGYRPVG